MTTGLTLLLLFGSLAIIGLFKGRDLYDELRLYRAWRERYHAGLLDDSPSSVQAGTAAAVSSSFDLAAPMTGTVLDGAGRACQDPPSDLRVSMAEQDRVDPQGRYPVPLGWWIGTTKPVLATAALVDDVNMTLVTGFTDSGKDNFVLSWLYSLGYRYTPRDIQFALICGKGGLSLNGWHTKQHTWLFARGKQDIQPAMEALVKERERRTKILWDSKCEKWEEYAGSDLPLLVVYVSELMLLQSIVGKTELADWLNEELTSCRAMGIRYIIGTQNATKLDTRWRSQVSLHVAGYQQSQDGDEPNTGVSSSVLRKLGTRADGVIVGVPPSELPIPPGGAGVFTLVQGRTVLTVRAPFLNREQRQWWLNQLPDDPAKVAAENHAQRQVVASANPQPADATTNPLLVALMTGQPLPIGDMPEQPVSQAKPPAIQLSEIIKRKTLGELEKDPLFIDACIQSYQRSGQVRPTTAEVFESAPGAKDGWTGSRQTIVTKALRTAGVLMVDSPSPAVQAA